MRWAKANNSSPTSKSPKRAENFAAKLARTMSFKSRLKESAGREATDKIRRMAWRNLKLALISTSSSLLALSYASVTNYLLPNPGSPGAEYTFYVKEIGQTIFLFDLMANTYALTAMSAAWQPQFLKRRMSKRSFCCCCGTRANEVVPFGSSVVSSLGGTKSYHVGVS
jgi:hypothetical protein